MPSPACWPRIITAPSSIAIKVEDFTYRTGRLTIHLAKEFGFCYGVDRAVDYAYQTRERFPDRARVPHRRNHPQPARQREAARHGHPVSERRPRPRRSSRADRRRHPPRLRRDDGDAAAARTSRLHADRHHLRLGAERLEERASLRRRRLHRGDSRQGLARGDAGDGIAGRGVRRPLPRRLRPRRDQPGLRVHPSWRRPRGVHGEIRFRHVSRTSTPIAICSTSVWRIRRRC